MGGGSTSSFLASIFSPASTLACCGMVVSVALGVASGTGAAGVAMFLLASGSRRSF